MMIENVLIFLDGALLLLFGGQLSAAFAGIRLTKRNVMTLSGFCTFCGALQLGAFIFYSEDAVRKLYPLITHMPLILFLCLVYRKRCLICGAVKQKKLKVKSSSVTMSFLCYYYQTSESICLRFARPLEMPLIQSTAPSYSIER